MTLRIKVNGRQAGRKLRTGIKRQQKRIRETVKLAADEGSKIILERGQRNIRGAGNFGSRWTEGLHADVTSNNRNATVISVFHDIPYWVVFQEGRVIRGRPLLWIPLSFADRAQGRRASEYPGRLFRVDRAGKAPLLLDYETKRPQYFGKESVTIPKKFRIVEIAREVSRELRSIYSRIYRAGNR